MATITAALTNFGQSVAVIGLSSLLSVLAVFQAIFALVQKTIENILKLGQSITILVLELSQGVFGFVVGRSCSLSRSQRATEALFTSELCCNFNHWWRILFIHA